MMVNNRAMICCGSLLPVFGVKRFGDVSPYSCSNYFSSVFILFYLFIQYFKRVAHLAVQLFYLAALSANIFTYIQTL